MKFRLGYGADPLSNRIALALRLFVLVLALSFFFGRRCLPQHEAGSAGAQPRGTQPPGPSTFQLAPAPSAS